jgi:hypothetical protein
VIFAHPLPDKKTGRGILILISIAKRRNNGDKRMSPISELAKSNSRFIILHNQNVVQF